MWIERGILFSKLSNFKPEEREWVVGYLSFEDKNARYTGNTKPIRFYNLFNDTFPSGFISGMRKSCPFPIELLDKRERSCNVDPDADLAWLRDYQLEAARAAAAKEQGLLWLPTGAGKTEIAIAISRMLPTRWLFLTHRTNLMMQCAERYEKRSPGLIAGRIGEGVWDVPEDATFICATFQTLNSPTKARQAQELLTNVGGVMVDECHVVPADSFWHVIMATRRAFYRFGLSGTPLAGDEGSRVPKLLGALGPVIYRIRSELLIQQGVLAKPKVRLTTVEQRSDLPTWQGVYGACVVRGKKRNATLVELAKKCTKPGFVFIKEVAHGKDLVRLLGRAGLRAELVYGTHSVDYRMSLVRRLVQGHFDVLVCSVVFQEGLDVPELRSVVVGSGGKSVISTLQRLGRGMRVERRADGTVVEGGDQFEVWDIYDKGNKWLERHTKQRLHTYAGEGFETTVEPELPLAL